MSNWTVLRRTFEAKKFPEGSAERAKFNEDALTSEYMPSYKYLLRKPALMSDGTPHPNQKWNTRQFKTKAEAEQYQRENKD